MNIISAALLFITVGDISKGKRNSITWHILNPPIIFGEDGVLFCNVSAIENNSTKGATWMKDFDVIFDHKASTNQSKYTQKQHSEGFSLIIKKIDKDDINHQYTCLYDFFSYSAVLGINKQDFQYIPNKDEIKANINRTSDTIIFADVMFEKVYPLPECFCIAHKEKINTNVTLEKEAQTGFLYRIKLKLVCEIDHSKWMESVEVSCTVGNDEIVINSDNFVNCLDINESLPNAEKKIKLMFLFFCLTLVAAGFTFGLIFWKKRKCSRRRSNACVEGSMANSTRSDNYRVAYWRREDDGNGEESELTPLLKFYSGSVAHSTRSDNRCVRFWKKEVASTSREWTSIPAQKDEDVTDIVNHGTGHDPSYIQRLLTNFKINIAFLWKSINRLKAFRGSSNMPIKEGQSMTIQSYGPAQKEKDVINMVNYAKIYDKDYAERLVSDTLINNARQKQKESRLESCPSVSALPCTNVSVSVSDVDAIKGSSMIPTWGARIRSRISITGKQGLSNEWKYL